MEINIYHLIEGAKKAEGLTVIIDVFRAFSTACYIMNNKAEKIITVGDLAEAYQIKEKNPGYILVGERNERKPEGFHFGNSPTEVKIFDFSGKTVVQTTSAGTQGIVNANKADEILAGSFVNADAITRYIKEKQPGIVSLVCMGYAAKQRTEEDSFCAEYIQNSLTGKKNDFQKMMSIIKKTSGKRFFDIDRQQFAPSTDFYLCMDINAFDFILKVNKIEDSHYLERVDLASPNL